jgi:hypothetical protein
MLRTLAWLDIRLLIVFGPLQSCAILIAVSALVPPYAVLNEKKTALSWGGKCRFYLRQDLGVELGLSEYK